VVQDQINYSSTDLNLVRKICQCIIWEFA